MSAIVGPKQPKWKAPTVKPPPTVGLLREAHLADRYAAPRLQRRPDFMKPR